MSSNPAFPRVVVDPSPLEQVRSAGVRRVGTALGFNFREEPKRGFSPCPQCSAEQRGSTDRRPPAEVTTDGLGWLCYRCGASGDAVTLAALAVTGQARPARWDEVLRRCADLGLCAGLNERPPIRQRPSISVVRSVSPAPAPRRPPAHEVQQLWESGLPVTNDLEVSAWLEKRGLDPTNVEDWGLARALPVGAILPKWASLAGRPWDQSGYRLILPLYGPTGVMESIRARSIVPSSRPKAVSPEGFAVRGLLMANSLGHALLAGTPLPDDTPSADLVRDVGLVIAEGDPDFLTWGSVHSDSSDSAPAVFGVFAGSWNAEFAARVPATTRVAIRTHPDEAGNKYAAEVIKTLGHRCQLFLRA
jgi:hypothetical protein